MVALAQRGVELVDVALGAERVGLRRLTADGQRVAERDVVAVL